jgi:hypothetical protein
MSDVMRRPARASAGRWAAEASESWRARDIQSAGLGTVAIGVPLGATQWMMSSLAPCAMSSGTGCPATNATFPSRAGVTLYWRSRQGYRDPHLAWVYGAERHPVVVSAGQGRQDEIELHPGRVGAPLRRGRRTRRGSARQRLLVQGRRLPSLTAGGRARSVATGGHISAATAASPLTLRWYQSPTARLRRLS